ncbi:MULTISPECIES: efflux RND transporter periplasmic adaptor subunit [unclassified Wenzhouxiangella]|uniref:efflux RND transporter periplasmic adaptor subunit n=1 Tax=unclassified Wenzhouxiangella TaxID=2613841 RepID=UPI000E326C51|nr:MULTISPECIES: efflux RND transporter periplasmic adaptor subunit [unclassified Wenzhouxiangella]RFF28456.1 efflux RND transporter periplasmic adaptor subunit [Wenzhouxiangella sp. 15181]RFP69973.1 efflux RND transporter periplasmic adaptor subunit [Wenzhouxiangella sp. 15190]
MFPAPLSHAQLTDRPASLLVNANRILLLPVLIMVLAVATACSDEPATQAPAPEPGQPVRIATVSESKPPVRLRLPGVTRAIERADLAFLHSGHLAERLVNRGEAISAGQPLAILHNPALMPGVTAAAARVNELEEQLQQLQRETRRLENLHERGLVATDELDRVRARRNAARQAREQAQARLDEARDQLDEATLRAPFSGRVVALPVEPGQFVSAGQPVVSVSAPERLEVTVDLSARQARALTVEESVRVRRLEGGTPHSGTIREIGLPAPGRPATAVIDLTDTAWPEWSPGQAVHVELSWTGDDRLSIPLDALIDTGDGLPHVFRLRDDHADLVTVIPGELDGGQVRVEGELETGDEVIVAGHGQLLDGERVRVLR